MAVTNYCSQTLAGIARDCAPSIGGVRRVLLASFADVKKVTAGEDGNKITAIEMESQKQFWEYNFKKGMANFVSTLNNSPENGTSYVSTDLVMNFTRMETAKRVEMSALQYNDNVAIVEDANGIYWYLGKDEPVCATAGSGETGTARGDKNGYSITLQDNSATFPLEVSAEIVDALLSPAV